MRFIQLLRGQLLAPNIGGVIRRVRWPFVVTILGTLVTFGLQVLLTRMLGVNVYGEYIYALTWINMLVMVGKFGFDTAALRFLPEYSTRGEWLLLRGFVRRSRQLVVIISCMTAAILVVALNLLSSRLSAELISAFLVGAILIPLNAYSIIQGVFLQAFHKIVLAQVPQLILKPILLAIGLLLIAWLMQVDMSASEVMWLTVIATAATIIVVAYMGHRVLPAEVFSGPCEYRGSFWFAVSIPMFLITGFNMLINQLDILMVGALLEPKDAGIYAVAARLTTFIPFGLVVVNSIVAPIISRLHTQGDLAGLQRLLTKVAWGSLAFSGPIFLILVLWREQILSLFGAEFITGSEPLVYLAFSRLVVAISGSSGYLLSLSGNQSTAAFVLGASAAVNVALNFVLIPKIGLIGAAIGSLIGTILWCTAMIIYGKKLVGVDGSVFASMNKVK